MQIWGYYWMFGRFQSTIKKYQWQTISLIIILLIMISLLTTCHSKEDDKKKPSEVITVELKHVSTPLHFNGKIEPLKIYNVTSPVEGTINEVFFKYGQQIYIEQKLFSISAERLEKEYVDNISSYLKALDDYAEKLRKFNGTEQLWKMKFVSDNEYHSDKIAKEEAFFSLKQAIRDLKDTLKKIGIAQDLKEIDIHNPHIIEEIVTKKLDNYIIASPYSGIALDPKSLSSVSKDDIKNILGGDVKSGEILLYIGDLSGIAVDVKVNEIDINQIKPGQPAFITGPGFSGIELKGKVELVKSQAHSDSGNLPTFSVRIVIMDITNEQREIIRVGMSTKVKIKTSERDAIIVPIEAVFQDKGIDYIKVKNKQTGKVSPEPVIVGRATVRGIEIEKGLKPGDQIVVDY